MDIQLQKQYDDIRGGAVDGPRSLRAIQIWESKARITSTATVRIDREASKGL